MTGDAEAAWDSLSAPWTAAFDQAWQSWCAGSFGIGAAIANPPNHPTAPEAVIAVGRNRIGERPDTVGQVSGSFVAHAEMNALASFPETSARGSHIFSTLEPCPMCAAAIMMMNVAHVHFAVTDEFFPNLDELWRHHPYTDERRPPRTGPLDGPLAAFGRVLPMAVQIRTRGLDHGPVRVAATRSPELVGLAERLDAADVLGDLARQGAPVVAALDAVWTDLRQITLA